MARPKKYEVDPDEILLSIFRQTIQRQKELEQQIKDLPNDRFKFEAFQQLSREKRLAEEMPYDAAKLVGHQISDSHRKAVQRCVRELEGRNLIKVTGTRGSWLRLTDSGRRRVCKIQKQQTA